MSDLVEGMGTATEGGLLARALEPASGARSRHPDDPESCLNCGTALIGAYCHACGQAAHIHRTIGGFLHDLLHGALHFEGRLWRTLPLLVLTPGRLTRRYIEGARARFVSPMALFLFCVFLMFAAFQILGVATLEPASFEENIADDVATGLDTGFAETNGDGVDTITAADLPASDFRTNVDWIDEGIIKKWRENPDLMLYKLQANSYKFSWLLIPLSVPFVWLLFAWKRRFRAYDHAIFVTYSLSFMTLLFVTVSILDAAGISSSLAVLPAMLVPPIHLYKQLRGAYALSRPSALWRLVALSVFIWIIILLFLQVLLVLGAF